MVETKNIKLEKWVKELCNVDRHAIACALRDAIDNKIDGIGSPYNEEKLRAMRVCLIELRRGL